MIFSEKLTPKRLGSFVDKVRKPGLKGLKCATQHLMGVVKKNLEVEEKVSVVVAEEETAVFAASGMRGNELIIEAQWLYFVVGVFRERSLGSKCVEVSGLVGCEGRQDAEHLKTPEVLLPLFRLQSLNVLPYSDGFHLVKYLNRNVYPIKIYSNFPKLQEKNTVET